MASRAPPPPARAGWAAAPLHWVRTAAPRSAAAPGRASPTPIRSRCSALEAALGGALAIGLADAATTAQPAAISLDLQREKWGGGHVLFPLLSSSRLFPWEAEKTAPGEVAMKVPFLPVAQRLQILPLPPPASRPRAPPPRVLESVPENFVSRDTGFWSRVVPEDSPPQVGAGGIERRPRRLSRPAMWLGRGCPRGKGGAGALQTLP